MLRPIFVLFCLIACVRCFDSCALATETVHQVLQQRIGDAELSMLFDGETPEQATRWQHDFRTQLDHLLGSTDPPQQWETIVESRQKLDDHVRYQITLKADNLPSLPLYLLVPNDGDVAGAPAVVAVHGHGEYGHHPVAGRDDMPGVAAAISSSAYDYGLQFVRRGYVVACPCLIPFGDRVDRDRYGSDPCAVTFVRFMALGRPAISENIRDIRWAVSFLQSRDEVDGQRIGCAGLSYGGRMTMMATAIDTRIRVAAISGALNLLQERASGRYSCGMQIVPGLLKYGDYSEIACLIAPRPCVWEMGSRDKLIVKNGWDRTFKTRMERIYNAYQQRDQLHYDHFEGGHRWNGTFAYELFDRVLKAK